MSTRVQCSEGSGTEPTPLNTKERKLNEASKKGRLSPVKALVLS